jgi:uncharacterized protein DUF5666/FecR-like protein
MDSLSNSLDEGLARLEAGEPLEACIAGLPEEDAILVKKAATLRALKDGGLTSDKAAAQRSELLKFAKEKRTMGSQSNQRTTRPRWLLPAAALSGVAALLLVCAVVASAATGLVWLWQKSQAPQAAQNATPVSAPELGSGSVATNPIALVAPNPQSAILGDARGIVEVQGSTGVWTIAKDEQTVKAGQHIRTGGFSSVTLGFYDGSQTRLGPNAELSVDQLDAQKSGPRVIMLTQLLGESKHDVAKSSDPASHYEVHTPSGVGTAKGTSFRVFVTTALLVRFDVDEGAVAVTSLNTTVIVVAGQSTVIVSGEIPTQPVFRMSGEGKVEQTGSVWHIAGRTFRIDSDTVFIGHPEVGDLVAFEALIVTDGSPILVRVVLLSSAPENQFSFSGKVESIGDAEWTVAGHAVKVNDQTQMDDGIQVGDTVQVKGSIAEDGTLLALQIRLIDKLPFEFTGVIQAITDTVWTISGIPITVNADTHIGSGLAAGDTVHVQGRVLANGDWLASSITRSEEDEGEFVITGKVESLNPWMVNGIGFETDSKTEIDDGIKVGDQVRVEGRILDNGHWVAEEIEILKQVEQRPFKITGLVSSIDPWNVGGITFTTDEHTVIEGQIAIGDLVQVKGVIMPDGTWLAQKIERLDNDLGCLSFSTAVRQADVNQIVLLDWHVVKLGKGIKVRGEVKVATVIILSGCTQGDGSFTIVNIIVIYQLDSVPVIIISPPHKNGEGDDEDDDDHDKDHGKDH